MKPQDEALGISNPRLLSAGYFVLLAIIATVILDLLMYSVGIEKILPPFEAILLAVVVAGCFGALFAKKIIYCTKPYRRKAFFWGVVMVFAALPVYDLLFFFLFRGHHPHAFEGSNFNNSVVTYFLILLYSFLFVGIWLAIAAGLAAIYLRRHLVYDILLHSKYDRKLKLKEPKQAKQIEEGQATDRPERAHTSH